MITPDNYIIKKITEDFEGLQKISRDNGSPQLVRGTVPCPNNDTNRPNNDNHPNNTSRPNDTQITKQISEQSKKIVLDIEKGGTREEIVESTLVNVQKLSDEHIVQLAEYAERIEEHYGKPMDIEWAVENGEIFILQARPITTLGEEKEIFEKAYTRDTTFIIQQARHD
jgi:phosphoenolpyruvate synthase/pyruvate phosphate dikinase